MKRTTLRSDCPINFSLEIFGDTWSLLILRDIIYFGKKTFNEFLASDENIARNILADRLKHLQNKGLLTKMPHPHDKRKEIYKLTENGLDIIPILLDLADWGAVHHAAADIPQVWIEATRERRAELLPIIRKTIQNGGSIFVGQPRVIDTLST
jgi:DNA-binding HxlR family transcriptional regulator